MTFSRKKIQVAFSVTNCICHDQRVLKIAQTVSNLNCDLIIIGRKIGDCCNSGDVPFRTRRFRMIFRQGFLFYMFFNIRLFIYLLFLKSDLLVSNDLDTLLPNYLISRIKKIPLIYDSHEYFTGVPEIQNRAVVKYVWKSIESKIFPRLTNIITVSDLIAQQYEEEYGKKPVTILNCSPSSVHILPFTKQELGAGKGQLVVILQGTGINADRGGEELIEAIFKTDNVKLLVVGSGKSVSSMKQKAVEYCLSERVSFFGTVPWEKMMRYTKAADVGMSLDKNTNLNHKFSLPNKLFDYISAGIAVVASDLPQVRKIVTESGSGVVLDEVTPDNISYILKKLDKDRISLREFKKNAILASGDLNWERESQKVKTFYEQVLKNNRLI